MKAVAAREERTEREGRREAPRDAEWPLVVLADVVDFIRGVTFDKTDAKYRPVDGHIPILRAGNIGNGLMLDDDLVWVPPERVDEDQMLRVGDLAICMSSGSPAVVGKTAQLREPWRGSVGAFCGIIRPRPHVHPDFVALWFRAGAFREWRDGQSRGANIQNLRFSQFAALEIPLPPLAEQERIAGRLTEQLAAVERARAAAQSRLAAAESLPAAYLREAFDGSHSRSDDAGIRMMSSKDCLNEVASGVGSSWTDRPLYGASRSGLTPAKEAIGKHPERYKAVEPGTVFYNPMRILLGSIAMLDEGEEAGITSPDYVVVRGRPGVLHHRIFYYWLRSAAGAQLIRDLARGGVRERILFNRLSEGLIPVLPWPIQVILAERLALVPRLVAAADAELAAIEALPAAYLRGAFGGTDDSGQNEVHGVA